MSETQHICQTRLSNFGFGPNGTYGFRTCGATEYEQYNWETNNGEWLCPECLDYFRKWDKMEMDEINEELDEVGIQIEMDESDALLNRHSCRMWFQDTIGGLGHLCGESASVQHNGVWVCPKCLEYFRKWGGLDKIGNHENNY